MLKLLHHMPRRDGATPELTKEQASLFIVYRRNEEEGYELHALYDEKTGRGISLHGKAAEFEGDCVGIPATTAVTYLSIAKGTAFKNVSGSSEDPMPAGSPTWLSLLVGHSETSCCCTDGYFYIDGRYFPGEKGEVVYKNNKPKFCDHIKPAFGGIVVGGHVLLDEDADPRIGTGGDVYLLPLCQTHNISRYNPAHNKEIDTGMGFYMVTSKNVGAAKIIGYLRASVVAEALAREEAADRGDQ